MDGDGRRAFLELELAAVQRLYDGEKARRESVRTSLAIPLASVTLIVLSVGTFGRFFIVPDGGVGTNAFSVAALFAAGFAIFTLLATLLLVGLIDYAAIDADGLGIDLVQQAREVEIELEGTVPDATARRRRAVATAITAAIRTLGRRRRPAAVQQRLEPDPARGRASPAPCLRRRHCGRDRVLLRKHALCSAGSRSIGRAAAGHGCPGPR